MVFPNRKLTLDRGIDHWKNRLYWMFYHDVDFTCPGCIAIPIIQSTMRQKITGNSRHPSWSLVCKLKSKDSFQFIRIHQAKQLHGSPVHQENLDSGVSCGWSFYCLLHVKSTGWWPFTSHWINGRWYLRWQSFLLCLLSNWRSNICQTNRP